MKKQTRVTSTEPKQAPVPLGSAEISAILDACSKAGVSVLKFGGLYVRFGAFEPRLTTFESISTKNESTAPFAHHPEAEISESPEKLAEIARIDLETEIAELKQAQLELMQIEQPELLEKLILQGKVTRHEEESEEDT